MRFLEVASFASRDVRLKLVEFFGANVPRYIILSHTWTDDEVLFADIAAGTAQHRRAFQKILFAVEQTQRDGWEYLWVDTCCIDKSSSAELQEAVDSMFTWYRKAERCYAYLDDVASSSDIQPASIANRAAAQPYSMTNKGLQVRLPLQKVSHGVYLAMLDCDPIEGLRTSLPGVLLRRLVSRSNQFARICCDKVVRSDTFETAVAETFFVRQEPEAGGWTDVLFHARRSRVLPSSLPFDGTTHSVRLRLSQSTKERFHAVRYAFYGDGDFRLLQADTDTTSSDAEPRVRHLSRTNFHTHVNTGMMVYEKHTNRCLVILLASPSPPFLRFGAFHPDFSQCPNLDLHLQVAGKEMVYAGNNLRYQVSITAQSLTSSIDQGQVTGPGHVLRCRCPMATTCCDRHRWHELTLHIERYQHDKKIFLPAPTEPLVCMGADLLARYALPTLPNFIPLTEDCPVHTVTGLGSPLPI